jgi:hypothetical protein
MKTVIDKCSHVAYIFLQVYIFSVDQYFIWSAAVYSGTLQEEMNDLTFPDKIIRFKYLAKT